MSWQAFEAVRDHSEARGATRTVGFVLASHADRHGGSVFIGIKTICEEAKVGRKAAVTGRRWFLENGEAEQVGSRPSATGSPTPILSFAPLLAKGSDSEPFKGSDSEPLGPGRVRSGRTKGSLEIQKGSLESRKGSLSEPETEGTVQETRTETKSGFLKKKQVEEKQKKLRRLEAVSDPHDPGLLRKNIDALRAELGIVDEHSDLAGAAEVEARIAAQREKDIAGAGFSRAHCTCGGTPDNEGQCIACAKPVAKVAA